jgi:hypothetical protein
MRIDHPGERGYLVRRVPTRHCSSAQKIDQLQRYVSDFLGDAGSPV